MKDLEFRLSVDKDKIRGMRSGLYRLDKTIDGFSKGNLITFVARSGIGKSTVATSIILKMLKDNKIVFFSMEMPAEQILKKMAFNLCNISAQDYQEGKLDRNELVRIKSFIATARNNKNLKIYSDSDFNSIISKIKLEKLKNNVDIVFVDYLNRITGVNGGTRDIEFNYITSKLKDIALQEDICIVALTQANRQVDKQTNKRITLADIKESSSIEQNSDVVIALYRNKDLDNEDERKKIDNLNYNSPLADINPECIEMDIIKNKYGVCDL